MGTQRIFNGEARTIERGVRLLFGSFTTTTSGTLSTTAITKQRHAGFTLAKVGATAGRYKVTLDKNYAELLYADAVLVGADDTGFTDAKGQIAAIRANHVSDGSTNDGTFLIQFKDNTDSGDDEVQDGAIIKIMIAVRDASV